MPGIFRGARAGLRARVSARTEGQTQVWRRAGALQPESDTETQPLKSLCAENVQHLFWEGF